MMAQTLDPPSDAGRGHVRADLDEARRDHVSWLCCPDPGLRMVLP